MLEKARILFCVSFVYFALAACHGGGSTVGNSGAMIPSAANKAAIGSASFALTIPAASASTMQSIVVTVTQLNGAAYQATAPAVKMNLAANAPGCAPAGGGAIACNIHISAPAGNDVFSVVTYAQPQGIGRVVSSTTATATIKSGSTTTCTQTKPRSVASSAATKP